MTVPSVNEGSLCPSLSGQTPVASEQVLFNPSEKMRSRTHLTRTMPWHQGQFVQCVSQLLPGGCHAKETPAEH